MKTETTLYKITTTLLLAMPILTLLACTKKEKSPPPIVAQKESQILQPTPKPFPDLIYDAWDNKEYLEIYNDCTNDWPWCLVFITDVFNNEYRLEWGKPVPAGKFLKIYKPDFVDRNRGVMFNPNRYEIKEVWVEVPRYKGGKIMTPKNNSSQ
jgi:hypothetical protein